MNSLEEVAGLQFNVSGVSIVGASGGAATEAGFMLSSSATTVLGFSLTGGTIPSGNYTVMYLDFSGDISTICIDGLIVSDPSGNAIDYEVGECWSDGSGYFYLYW